MKHIYFLIFTLTFSIAYSQCVTTNYITGTSLPDTETSALYAQGFTAECDGNLEYVKLHKNSVSDISATTLNIYSGNGVSGTPIYTQSNAVQVADADHRNVRIDLTQDLELTNGNQYTFEFTMDGTPGTYYRTSNPYAGGTAWKNSVELPTTDFDFEVSISETTTSPPIPCEIINYITGSSLPDTPTSALYAQGFTAECDGNLEYVQLHKNSVSDISATTLNIYSGNDVTGTPIYTQSNAVQVADADHRNVRINLTQELQLTNGNQYTFEFTMDGTPGTYYRHGNPYAGGTAWRNSVQLPTVDFDFRVSISNTLSTTGNDNSKKIIKVFPNPSSKSIRVSGLKEKANYSIYDILGSEIKHGVISNQTEIDIRNFSNGLYFLKFNDGNTIKFIKK